MSHALFRRMGGLSAVFLLLLAGYVLIGWVRGDAAMVRVVPGSVAMSINTALMFLMCGACLLLTNRGQWQRWTALALSLVVTALSSAILSQHVFGVDLGVDMAAVHQALGDGHSKPGRTAPNACIGFLSAGLAFLFVNVRRRPLQRRTAAAVVATLPLIIGIAALIGYFLSLDAMYRIASLNRMALFTAIGMTTLGLGLRSLIAPRPVTVSGETPDEAGRITRLAALLLVIFAIATGLSTFALLRGSFEQSAAQHHAQTARTAAVSLASMLHDATLLSTSVANRPSLVNGLAQMADDPAAPGAMAQLETASAAFVTAGFRARVLNPNGVMLLQIGESMTAPPGYAAPFGRGANTGKLFWNEGYRIQSVHQIRVGQRLLGMVETERKLNAVDAIIAEYQNASASTDVVLCGRETQRAECFPSRHYPKGMTFAMFDSAGQPKLPISRALLGEAGATRATDPRGLPVLAGYTPVRGFPLGIVVKTEVSELYVPLREKLHWIIAAVALFVAIGTFLLRRVVEPLIHQIVAEKRRVKDLLDNCNDAFIAIGPNGRVSDWNRQAEITLGIAAQDAIGTDLAQLIIPERLRAAHNAGFARFLDSGTLLPTNSRVQVTALHASGREIPVELSVSAVRHPEGLGASAFLRDLTEQKAAEAKAAEQANAIEEARLALAKSQRLEAVGKLTGGVAHDFNNVLQVVRGNLELLTQDEPAHTQRTRRLHSAMDAVDRGAKLSSQLLAFARRQPLEPQPTDVARVLRTMEEMLQRAIGDGVEIELVASGSVWNAMVDPNQLEHVILNLAINARDAMQGSGKLTIEAGNALLDDDYAQAAPELQPGQFVMLAISDTGCGMSQEVLERAFEPFFTTKPEGQGTGLGLSMAYGFVKQSHGHIKIYSEPGEGTTIRIYLPRTGAAATAGTERVSHEIAGGTETVLVVEDDAAVQATVIDILTGLGYQVLKAGNAAEAMALLETGVHVDLLFTDVVMPGPLRSPELARRACVLLPRLKVLFTSGYTQNAIVHGGRLDPGIALLSKPYRRDQLARKVRAVLGPAALHSAPVTAPDTGAPVIAFVEDNDDFRMLGAELMAMLGFSVDSFANAEDALDPLRSGKFTCLLTDVGLPGMSGVELGKLVHEARPDIAIIFATGFGEALPSRPDFPHKVLAKPFTIEHLEACIGGTKETAAGFVPGASA